MKKTALGKRDFKFDKQASYYDTHIQGRLSEKAYRLITNTIRLKPEDNILDAGCGTGTVLKRLNAMCRINGFGIDIEDKMIEQARSKLPQMKIQKCDCSSTPFENEFFDSIVACMTFHHFHDQTAFAKEMARVLKKGGKIYIVDPNLPALLRKIVNTLLANHDIVGKFSNARQISAFFNPSGFVIRQHKRSFLFQLIVLEKV